MRTGWAIHARFRDGKHSDAERESRVLELYDAPNTLENSMEFFKLMLGDDLTVEGGRRNATIPTGKVQTSREPTLSPGKSCLDVRGMSGGSTNRVR